MALEIDWREPPTSMEDRLKQALKHNAGKWARIKKDMKSPTSKSAWRKEGFEADSYPAESDPKLYDIYARWPNTADRIITEVNVGVVSADAVRAATRNALASAGISKPPATKPQPVDTKEDADLQTPASSDVSGGYLASRARRAVPADGATTIRPAGHHPSPVRP